MERFERRRLEQIRNKLQRDLNAISEMLQAPTPRRIRKAERKRRSLAICRELTAAGRTVKPEQLRAACLKHGMPYSAVGSLFVSSYLTRTNGAVHLGPRALEELQVRRERRRRAKGTRRKSEK